MKRPAFQFYPADWRKDPALSSCSLAARGLWIELICIAHESDRYGHLSVNGRAMTPAQLARMVGESPKTFDKLLQELEDAAVFSRDEDGVIYSRRMLKDEHIRNVRAASGKQGGNPNLLKQKVKQNDKQNPTPSSSSSSTNKTTTQAAGHNPGAGNAFDETEGQGPTRDVAGDVAFWQPDLDQLRPRLVMAGVPIPEPPDIDRMLVGFRDYFTGKHHTQGQCYTKFVNWIQRERNDQTKTSIRVTTGTRPAPEQSPAVSAIELARDKALRRFDHEEID